MCIRDRSSSGDWSGNICDFYFRVYNRIAQDIKVPFKLNGADRIFESPDHDGHSSRHESRRYDATPYAEWLLICSLVNDYFKTFSSQGNILDAAKILPCPDMLAPIKIMIHKCEIRLRSFSVNGRPFFRGVSYIAVHLYAKTAAASLWAAQRQFSSYIFF